MDKDLDISIDAEVDDFLSSLDPELLKDVEMEDEEELKEEEKTRTEDDVLEKRVRRTFEVEGGIEVERFEVAKRRRSRDLKRFEVERFEVERFEVERFEGGIQRIEGKRE